MKIENKVVIVTGGASGLGEATVRWLANLKAKVILKLYR
jgi:NAD(P)-dependent dehydrogenase (short-subunit alcohol dehydrogenase family)